MTELEEMKLSFFESLGSSTLVNTQGNWVTAIELFVEYCKNWQNPRLLTERIQTEIQDSPPYDGIWYADGKYHCRVQIQDGVEYIGPFDTEGEVQLAYVQAHNVLNHTDLTMRDAPKTIRFEAVYRKTK